MDSEYIDSVMDEARDFWVAQTGKPIEEFDAPEAIMLYCNLSEDDLKGIKDYIDRFVVHTMAHFVIDMMMSKNEDGDGIDLNRFIEMALSAAMPVSLIVAHHHAVATKTPTRRRGDEFATTTFATAMIGMAKDEDDLEDIWPQQIVDDVASQFNPEDAFRIGVLCGKHG